MSKLLKERYKNGLRNETITIVVSKIEKDIISILAFQKSTSKELRTIIFRSPEYNKAKENYDSIQKSELTLFNI